MKELIDIQYRLKAPKDTVNNKYFKYRTTAGILEAVKPLLKEYNMYVLLSDDIASVGGSKYFLKATASLYSADGTMVAQTSACAELDKYQGMSCGQATGASSSYARKYALCGLFAIDDSKCDPDAQPENAQAMEARDFMAKNPTGLTAYCEMFHHTKLEEFTQQELVECYNRLVAKGHIKK